MHLYRNIFVICLPLFLSVPLATCADKKLDKTKEKKRVVRQFAENLKLKFPDRVVTEILENHELNLENFDSTIVSKIINDTIQIPTCIQETIKGVSLQGCKLLTIPKFIFSFKKLKKLYLAGNILDEGERNKVAALIQKGVKIHDVEYREVSFDR